jgi:Tfp pilus assembly protein PilV
VIREPRGFTLVEVLLAVILIDVGLLALVAGSVVLVRQTTALRTSRDALQAATNRLQQLGADRCVSASGTADGPLSIHEEWSATPMQNGVREMRDSVSFTAVGEQRFIALRTRLPC